MKKILIIICLFLASPVLAAPTSLRPNPFDLVEEEAAKQFAADKNSLTEGIAESPDFSGAATVFSNFSSFITPLLSNPAEQTGFPTNGFPIVPSSGAVSLDFPNDSTNAIAHRAWEIINNLERGFWNAFNRSPDYPELFDLALFTSNPNLEGIDTSAIYVNMFWCTQLIMKAYSETGHPFPADILYTVSLSQYFIDQNRFLDGALATYNDVSPGDVAFFAIPSESAGIAHVAIVYDVNTDGIITVEANAPYKSMFYPTDESGHFQIVDTGYTTIRIVGFGTP